VEIHVLWAPRCVISRAVLSQYMPPITHALKARLRHAFSDTAAVATRTPSHIYKRVKVNHGLLFATRIGIIHPPMMSSSSKLLPLRFLFNRPEKPVAPSSSSHRLQFTALPTAMARKDDANHMVFCRPPKPSSSLSPLSPLLSTPTTVNYLFCST
jgi:hypothetical protein